MRLHHFLCCLPLVWGVAITGIVCGTLDFVMGSMGWQMVIQDRYADWLILFFRQMSIRSCVSACAVCFYVMAFIHFLLAYGAYTDNHLIIGSWLLINYTVFLFTLVTGLLSGLAILRIIAVGYTIIVVRSHYENLTIALFEEDADAGYSSDELSDSY